MARLVSCNPSAHTKRFEPGEGPSAGLGNVIVSFDAANAGILNGMSGVIELRILAAMNQRKQSQDSQSDILIETLGTGGKEHWYEKVEDALHEYVETLTPAQFLDSARAFLEAIGLNGVTEVVVDGTPLSSRDLPGKMYLKEALEVGLERVRHSSSVREIEVGSFGRNDQFMMWLNSYYTRRHRHDRAGVEIEVRAMSNELGPKQGESFQDYRSRMKALDADPQRYYQTFEAIDVQKKALFSDLSYHLSEAFPGVRLQLYESVPQGEG